METNNVPFPVSVSLNFSGLVTLSVDRTQKKLHCCKNQNVNKKVANIKCVPDDEQSSEFGFGKGLIFENNAWPPVVKAKQQNLHEQKCW